MKIFLLLCSLFILEVNASECDLSGYSENLIFTYEQLGESETFKIYVSNIADGISVESGRWLSSDGFLDYITYGSVKYVNVFVSDGSECAGEILKVIEVSVDKELYYENESEVVDEILESDDGCEVESDVIFYSYDELTEGVSYEDVVVVNESFVEDYEPPVINQYNEEEIVVEEGFNFFYLWVLIVLLIFAIFVYFRRRRNEV